MTVHPLHPHTSRLSSVVKSNFTLRIVCASYCTRTEDDTIIIVFLPVACILGGSFSCGFKSLVNEKQSRFSNAHSPIGILNSKLPVIICVLGSSLVKLVNGQPIQLSRSEANDEGSASVAEDTGSTGQDPNDDSQGQSGITVRTQEVGTVTSMSSTFQGISVGAASNTDSVTSREHLESMSASSSTSSWPTTISTETASMTTTSRPTPLTVTTVVDVDVRLDESLQAGIRSFMSGIAEATPISPTSSPFVTFMPNCDPSLLRLPSFMVVGLLAAMFLTMLSYSLAHFIDWNRRKNDLKYPPSQCQQLEHQDIKLAIASIIEPYTIYQNDGTAGENGRQDQTLIRASHERSGDSRDVRHGLEGDRIQARDYGRLEDHKDSSLKDSR